MSEIQGWFLDGRDPLVCPECGFEYTHHEGVTILQRQHEDGDGTRSFPEPRGRQVLLLRAIMDSPGPKSNLSAPPSTGQCRPGPSHPGSGSRPYPPPINDLDE